MRKVRVADIWAFAGGIAAGVLLGVWFWVWFWATPNVAYNDPCTTCASWWTCVIKGCWGW
jgi:hypothetical protein